MVFIKTRFGQIIDTENSSMKIKKNSITIIIYTLLQIHNYGRLRGLQFNCFKTRLQYSQTFGDSFREPHH